MAELGCTEPMPRGYQFGRYVIESELPGTPVGRMYKAFDTVMKAAVALNVLSPELRNDRGLTRLVALTRLARSDGQKAYDMAEWDGIPFIVLAYVEGIGVAVDVDRYWASATALVP